MLVKLYITLKLLDNAVEESSLISGQKPVVTQERKNLLLDLIFVKECQSVRKLHLRGERMYEFLDKLSISFTYHVYVTSVVFQKII